MTKLETGLNILSKLHGAHMGEKIMAATSDVAPDFLKMTAEFAMAEFMERPHIDIKIREFLILALCLAQGHMPQAKAHIESAFGVGATKEEISEVILQLIPVCGFPVAANGLMLLKEIGPHFSQS